MRRYKSLAALASLMIVFGMVMTLETCGLVMGISRLWPAFTLVFGVGFIMLFFNRSGSDAALIWIGAFIVLCSLLFFYLNFTSWSHLAQLWPLFLGIVGLSFLVTHLLRPNLVFMYLSLSFVALFIAFYLIFGVSLALWPVCLIIFGSSLFVVNYYNKC